MGSKKQLAIALSKLQRFSAPKAKLEQYATDSEIAGTVLWHAHLQRDIEGKVIADLGCGPGILGIGALLLGAKHVHFVDLDTSAIAQCKENLQSLDLPLESVTFHVGDVSLFDESVDTVLQNPPFGTKEEHADKVFLEKAFSVAHVIYSFHKTTTDAFVQAISKDHGFSIQEVMPFTFPLRNTMRFHEKTRKHIKVSCYILRKNG